MDRKKLIISGAAVIIALIILIIILISLAGGTTSVRDKKIKVIQRYIERGEYERALDLAEDLLIENPDDQELQNLLDEILQRKKLAEDSADDEKNRLETDNLNKLIESVEKSGQQPNPIVKIEIPNATHPPAIPTQPPKSGTDEKTAKINNLLKQGEAEREEKKYDDAMETFNEVLKLDKDSGEAYARLGQTYLEQNEENQDNIKKAMDNSRKAIDKDPTLSLPHKTLGRIYDNAGDYEGAENEYKQALRLDPLDWDAFYRIGVVQYRTKRYVEARQSFDSCLKIKSDYARAHYNKGLSCRALGDLTCARNSYQQAIVYDPSLYSAYNALGTILTEKGEYTAAINAFSKAVEKAPADSKARYYRNLADAQIAKGDFKSAESSLSSSLSLEPGNTDANYKLAVVKHNLNKANEALPFAQQAVLAKPDNETYNYQLGLIYESLGETNHAITYYTKAIQLNSNYASPLINLGNIYMDMKSNDQALTLLTAAYKLDTNNYLINNSLGNIYRNKELYQDSIKYLEKAIALKPDATTPRFNLADAYNKTGKTADAKKAFSELINLDSSYWDAYFEYGQILLAEGDKTNAQMIFKTLIAKKPDYEKRLEVDFFLKNLE